MNDLREACRSLRRTSTTSVFAVLSLALGIGSSAAVFSIANALLLRALPVHEPERLALVTASADGRRGYFATRAAWEQIRDRRLFESAFAWSHKKLDLAERVSPSSWTASSRATRFLPYSAFTRSSAVDSRKVRSRLRF